MKKYKVDSISKYLAVLEKNNISNYIYRGQNEPYFSIKASGFRPYRGGWSSDMIYDIPHVHTAFYNRVIGQLSSDEKKYFLAFCQHHGIPTNLVDVSYSPLVALFFACDGKGERKFTLSEFIGDKSIEDFEKDTSYHMIFIHNLINQAKKSFYSPFAQIYMINKERLVDITDIIVELNDKNLFEELLVDEMLILKLYTLIKEHFKIIKYATLNNWLRNILAIYVEICEQQGIGLSSDELYLSIKSTLSTGVDDTTYKDIIKILGKSYLKPDLFQKLFNNEQLAKEKLDYTNISALYTMILVEILDILKNAPIKINIELDILFTYQPPQLFKRISSQQSFFIYQPYLYTNDGVYDYCELNMQSINPDVIIEIDNYSSILQELSLLGIDNGTIYGDIDNIAKSVLGSSGKLLKVWPKIKYWIILKDVQKWAPFFLHKNERK